MGTNQMGSVLLTLTVDGTMLGQNPTVEGDGIGVN